MHYLSIGDGGVPSEFLHVSDSAHGLDIDWGVNMGQPLESKGPVTIARYVFTDYGDIMLIGVTLGDHCVLSTRSVVTRSFLTTS